MARKAAGIKVGTLTPDNVKVLRDADARSQLGQVNVTLTATTATFLCASATAALGAVNGALRDRKRAGQETRPLHAVRRKLEKLVEAERTKITAGPNGCYHVQGAPLGHDRAKCVDCGLVVDVHPGMEMVSPNRPTRTVYNGDKDPAGTKAAAKVAATVVSGDVVSDFIAQAAAAKYLLALRGVLEAATEAILAATAAGRPPGEADTLGSIAREAWRLERLLTPADTRK
jgi:ferredoxin-like protein FixX